MRDATTSTARRRGGAAPPFRYEAVVYGSGEVGTIAESIGRRRTRQIDPASREGRRLLNAGDVRLWLDPLGAAEKAPVATVLGRLRADVERERQRFPDDDRWCDHCRQRIATIDHWRTVYAGDH
jgi:hypothetical protein